MESENLLILPQHSIISFEILLVCGAYRIFEQVQLNHYYQKVSKITQKILFLGKLFKKHHIRKFKHERFSQKIRAKFSTQHFVDNLTNIPGKILQKNLIN
jgi:hypothetical protein